MQPILCLVPDDSVVTFECVVSNLLASVGGQTVHNRAVVDEVSRDLKTLEVPEFLLAFVFLPHTDPDVRVDDVRIRDSLLRVVCLRWRVPEVSRALAYVVADFVPFGSGNGQVDVGHRRPQHERLADVVAVANPRDRDIETTERIPNRQQVRERLAGVSVVGETVDDRHRGVLGEFDHVGVVEDACHDEIDVPGDGTRSVANRLSVTEVDVVRTEKDGVTAELCHPRLEGDAGACRGFLENHRQRLVGQRQVGVTGRP